MKFTKISVIVLIVLLFISSLSYATDIDMNISTMSNNSSVSSNTSSSSSNTVTSNNNISASNNITNTSNTSNASNVTQDASSEVEMQSTTISSVQQTSDGLSFSNILNILLIVIGVVLILLAIAILIRIHG